MALACKLAAKLLHDAAVFFTTVGNQNESIKKQMFENASVYKRLADLIEKDPNGTLGGFSIAQLGASSLREAADYFTTLGNKNEELKEQMSENSKLFQDIADIIEVDPQQIIGDNGCEEDDAVQPTMASGSWHKRQVSTRTSLSSVGISPFPSARTYTGAVYIPVVLGVSIPSSGNARFWTPLSSSKALGDFRKAILKRDLHTCRFCGFRSGKYQEVIVRQGADWDSGALTTACIFCAQCMMMERTSEMRSAVLIWAPEIPQSDLNTLMRVIYLCRIYQGPPAEKARKILDLLMERRQAARSKIGTDDPAKLASDMVACSNTDELCSLHDRIGGIRLVSLDRRIIREADLEFNQFPQILAYWRSKAGPLNIHPSQMDLSVFDRILEDGLQPIVA